MIGLALIVLLLFWSLILLVLVGLVADMPFFERLVCSGGIC